MRPEADLAIFPELFLGGYDLATVEQTAVELDGPELEVVRRAAAEAGTAVLIGLAERDGDRVANSLVAIDEAGEVVAVHRKISLWGDETDSFEAGAELKIVELAGRRIGLLICYEIEFPEMARSLAIAGANLLVTSSANMAPYFADHQLSARARALDNRIPHCYVNRVGSEMGLEFVGGTRVVGSDGTVLEEAPERDECLIVTDVPVPERAEGPADYLGNLPPQLSVAVLPRS
uniref:Unannotated protein n=1 Tax=freshwater metagenome TaxID=449393 RepID=A0A6J5Z4T0_9ZZZZ